MSSPPPFSSRPVTRAGRRLTGRLVYDFDETETTETLDVSLNGVDYAIPFDLIAAIVPPGREGRGTEWGRVVLRSGEELTPERSGDLAGNEVGVHVERPARIIHGDRRNDRDEAAFDELPHDVCVDALDLTDAAGVDFFPALRLHRLDTLPLQKEIVLSREAHGATAVALRPLRR